MYLNLVLVQSKYKLLKFNTLKQSIILTICTLILLFSFSSCENESKESMNIILITVDNLGINELGATGNPDIKTPHLNQLAASGATFSKAYTGSPDFKIAQSTLLSGQHVGNLVNENVSANSSKMFGLFQEHGFATAIQSKQSPSSFPANFQSYIDQNKDQSFLYFAPLQLSGDDFNLPPENPNVKRYESKDWTPEQKIKAAKISWLDEQIGVLLKTIQAAGLEKNTLLLFCAAGGASKGLANANGDLRGFAGDLYDGGIRVPMMMTWSGTIPAGQKVDRLVYFPDFLPTLLQAAAYKKKLDPMDGLSFFKLLKNIPEEEKKRFVYWQTPDASSENFQQVLRYRQWKMMRTGKSEPWKLYDMITDPKETDDVSAYHPGKMQKFKEWVAKNI